MDAKVRDGLTHRSADYDVVLRYETWRIVSLARQMRTVHYVIDNICMYLRTSM
jgi:hypothetical protein